MKSIKFGAVLVLAICFVAPAFAQIQYDGEPLNWTSNQKESEDIPGIKFPPLDMEVIRAADEVTDQYKETPYRFGWEHDLEINLLEEGLISSDEEGNRVLHYNVECEGATSISLTFNDYVLPKGCKLFVINKDRTDYLGAFDRRNAQNKNQLAIGLLHTDLATIELQIPAAVDLADVKLQISQIVQGYRSIVNKFEAPDRGPFGSSGPCNINVNCPEGDDWQTEKKSVALIVSGGFAVCSGALVNNTNNDGTPYFLTANHCLGGNTPNWVFYFNHEHDDCNGSTGPTDQSVSGCEIMSSNSGSDFALLLLDETPPDDFDVQFAGWDATDDETVISTTGIHHPSGDVKKICHDYNESPSQTTVGGAAVWYINQWEEGVTEGGSSGSPLFDQNHRIIGQLYGGWAACAGNENNGDPDWYGRFGVSWDGNSANNRLRDWLDPGNTGILILDGYPNGFVAAENDVSASGITDVDEVVCSNNIYPSVAVRNNGSETLTSATITHSLNGNENSFTWNGNLEQYEEEVVFLGGMPVQEGSNVFQVTIDNPNGVEDENENNNTSTVEFEAITGETHIMTIEIILDEYGSETTWQISDDNTLWYSGGPYSDDSEGEVITKVVCLPTGCYDFTIFDSFGDGICCGYGDGEYTVYNEYNNVAANGGEFDYQESTEVCTAPISVEEINLSDFLDVYPVPATDMLTVAINGGMKLEIVRMLDLGGRIIYQRQGAMRNLNIDVSSLSPGMYILETFTQGQSHSQKIVIE